MKRITLFAAIAVIAAFNLSCTKENEPAQKVEPKDDTEEQVADEKESGHEAVIGLSLGADTKTSHVEDVVAGKTNVKTVWKSGDKILVSFTKSEVAYNEEFDLFSGEDTPNAVFKKADSELVDGISYSVTYYSSNNYSAPFSWANQTGSVEDIPEYLTSESAVAYPAAPSLVSQLVHFHFVLNAGQDPGDAGLSLENAYFSNGTHPFIVDTENNTGEIKVTPAAAFTYSDSGVSTNADFYISVKLAADSASDIMKMDLMNGDHFDGMEGYSVAWTAKSYSTEKVYKVTSVANGEGKLLEYNNGLLGSTSNDAYATTSPIVVNKGEQLNINFINYTSKTNNWDNWRLRILDDSDVLQYNIRADVYQEVVGNAGLFTDNYGTAGGWGDSGAEWWEKRWPVFRNMMDGAEVNLNLNFSSTGKVFLSAVAVSSSGQKYVETYVSNSIFPGDVLKVYLDASWSHAYLKKASVDSAYESFSVSKKPGYSTTYYALSDAVFFDRASVEVKATKADASVVDIDPDVVSFGTLPASETTNASVSANFGGLAEQIVDGITVNLGTTQAGGPDCCSLYNWGGGTTHTALANGQTATVKFMLYSGMRENYHTALVFLFDSADTEKYLVRLDNALHNSSDDSWSGGTNDWNWSVFKTAQNHSDVTLTVTNTEGTVDVTFDVTYANGEIHQQKFTGIAVGTNDIKFNLNTEHSCVVVYSETIG